MTMNVIAKTVLMREREFAIHALMTNGNVTTANAFESFVMTTKNVIAKMAVMSQICNVMHKLKLSN